MKWINRLIAKITHVNFDLNNSFEYYGHYISCQSGTTDYVDVTIDNEHTFTFDFWTKEITMDMDYPEMADAIIKAFKSIYKNAQVVY